MARDLGLSLTDLDDLLPRAADNAALMDQMMIARGLNPIAVRAWYGSFVRDMELTCSRCGKTRRCAREVANGTAEANCAEFRANAGTLDELVDA